MYYAVMPQIYYIFVAKHAGLKDYSQILKHTESEICRMATYDSVFFNGETNRRVPLLHESLEFFLFFFSATTVCHNVCHNGLP